MMAWAAIRLFAFLLSVVIGLCRVHTHWLVGGGWMDGSIGGANSIAHAAAVVVGCV